MSVGDYFAKCRLSSYRPNYYTLDTFSVFDLKSTLTVSRDIGPNPFDPTARYLLLLLLLYIPAAKLYAGHKAPSLRTTATSDDEPRLPEIAPFGSKYQPQLLS